MGSFQCKGSYNGYIKPISMEGGQNAGVLKLKYSIKQDVDPQTRQLYLSQQKAENALLDAMNRGTQAFGIDNGYYHINSAKKSNNPSDGHSDEVQFEVDFSDSQHNGFLNAKTISEFDCSNDLNDLLKDYANK